MGVVDGGRGGAWGWGGGRGEGEGERGTAKLNSVES